MFINTECIKLLIRILEGDRLDKGLYRRFIRTKGIKGFLDHQNSLGKINVEARIKREINKVISHKAYRDIYGFYIIKGQIQEARLDIQYIDRNKDSILKAALKDSYKIVPKEIAMRPRVYLYCGGIDGGFTINRKNIYINFTKFVGRRQDFNKILAHEMYHSRRLPIENRIIYFLKLISKENRLLYELVGKTIEEGIASLVQHGHCLQNDDPMGNLTRRQLLLAKYQFELMNDILTRIRRGRYRSREKKPLNIYIIGYLIVSLIYRERGVQILDYWTVDLNYKKIIEEYANICREKDIPLGFEDEIIEWIIG